MAVVLIFNHVYWFSQKKNTLGKLVTMATRKLLFLIYKIENFANSQFWKVTKFQGAGLFRCGVLSSKVLKLILRPFSSIRAKYDQKPKPLSLFLTILSVPGNFQGAVLTISILKYFREKESWIWFPHMSQLLSPSSFEFWYVIRWSFNNQVADLCSIHCLVYKAVYLSREISRWILSNTIGYQYYLVKRAIWIRYLQKFFLSFEYRIETVIRVD